MVDKSYASDTGCSGINEGIELKCPSCNDTHILRRNGTPDGRESLYTRIIQEELRAGKKFAAGMPSDIVDALKYEVSLYSHRSLAFEQEVNYENALMDTERAIRIMDYLVEHLPETSKRKDAREKVLNQRAVAETKRAMAGAKLATWKGDFSRAFRCYSRAEAFLIDFYTNVHKLDPTAEAIETPEELAYELIQKSPSLGLMRTLVGIIEREKQETEFVRHSGVVREQSTKFSPDELPLDQQISAFEAQLESLVDKEDYEEAAKVRDKLAEAKALLEKRQREDPLELEKRYVLG